MVILALIFLSSVSLEKSLSSVPIKELRRRARAGKDKSSAKLYRLAVFGNSTELFLRLVAALSLAGLALIAANSSWWLCLLTITLAIWIIWPGKSRNQISSLSNGIATMVAPIFSTAVSVLQPILKQPANWLVKPVKPSYGLYEKEDLQELLKSQVRAPGSRIAGDDLKLAFDALGFSDKSVADAMTPRRKVKWVAAGDTIGPMLMDELHKTGNLRFPVVKEITKSGTPEVVGSLYLNDLLEHLEDKGRIRDIMLLGANYVNESQNLLVALDGFLKSGRHLLLVVNNFEEIAGVLTLEDIFERIIGRKIEDNLDRYSDIRLVAAHENGQTDDKEIKTK